ncbi:uncharacterized protein LOC121377579 [Gigantopelta aegis]|uniref:uncharacterized protein LOC121377579 n=1 Tax=Gigantopelta aegis TaxID=1735272 RepID=UPI001B888F56|nr:uncharacterized protein LOC121377579 [Gigantopelta aegis]
MTSLKLHAILTVIVMILSTSYEVKGELKLELKAEVLLPPKYSMMVLSCNTAGGYHDYLRLTLSICRISSTEKVLYGYIYEWNQEHCKAHRQIKPDYYMMCGVRLGDYQSHVFFISTLMPHDLEYGWACCKGNCSDLMSNVVYIEASDECGLQCENGGTVNKVDCSCKCTNSWTGLKCELCDLNCENGGDFDPDNCTCDCLDNWTGKGCETIVQTPQPLTDDHDGAGAGAGAGVGVGGGAAIMMGVLVLLSIPMAWLIYKRTRPQKEDADEQMTVLDDNVEYEAEADKP